MKCSKCQTDLPETANFCLKCGHELAANEGSPNQSSLPDAERKRVTALFADLSGYTAITEKLDPEEVKEITSKIFDGVKAIISKYEGFIERIAGDGLLALFGVPKAHEDDPIRAIRAAREIHALVDDISPEYEAKINRALCMHSGVNTGLAVTSDMDMEKGSYGVTGDAINTAARLSDLAKPNEILIGPETHRASKTHFTFQPLKPTKVKGKSESIAIYKVLSEKTGTANDRQEMQISSEMVGRDQELAKLELHILKAVNGHGSVVNIFGEPGIGKSRLLAELRQRDVISRVSFLEGRSISIGKNLSFHPIIDLFKQWARIKGDDGLAEASNKLEIAIRRVCGDEVDEVFPFVATMIGMKLSGKHSQRVEGIEGEALEKLILKNVRELLIRSTELIPIVIVMEDLHWADTTSLELLESLFRLAQTYRVVFINVFRPGYWQGDDRKVETLPEWLSEVDFAEIAIKPLDRQTGEVLVNNMLQVKGLRYAVKKQIVDRSGGNPFFMEEIVRSLIDEGAIVRTNGAFQVTEKIDHVVIPSTINDVLAARIDRLEEKTRDLIKVASVIGRSFFDRILKDVADSIEEVDERLAYLKDAQFIRDRMRMEELEYLFKHALAQEAAYESTLIQQRKVLHRKVAQSIEKIFQERLHEFYGMLAFHYSKAEELDKAEQYLIKAGEEALRSSASSEAFHYYREALNLYLKNYGNAADPEKVFMLERNIAIALSNKGQFVEALEYIDRTLSSIGVKTPKHLLSSLWATSFSFIKFLIGLYLPFLRFKKIPTEKDKKIIDLGYRKCEALAISNPKRFLFESINLEAAISRFQLTKIEKGIGMFSGSALIFNWTGISFGLSKRILDLCKDRIDGDDIESRLYYEVALLMHNFLTGYWASINEYDEILVKGGLEIGQSYILSVYVVWHGLLYIERGCFDAAQEMVDKLAEISETFEQDYARILNYQLNSRLLLKTRMLQAATANLDEGIKFLKKTDMGMYLNDFYTMKAQVQILSKDINGAEASLLSAKNYLMEVKPIPYFYSPFLLAQCSVDIYRMNEKLVAGNKSDLSEFSKRAQKTARKAINKASKTAYHLTEALRIMGTYYWSIDKQRTALKWWSRSIAKGEQIGTRLELSRTYFEVGKRLSEPNSKFKELNGINAEEYLKQAKEMFSELNLQWDLGELDKITL